MISGAVNLLRQPAVNITVLADNGPPRTIEANLDTAFSGDLTLPKAAIEQLDLQPADRAISYRTGDGAMTLFNTYMATVRWHDSVRDINVLESEIFPVIGVGLLWENSLSIDFKIGGDVAITELPHS